MRKKCHRCGRDKDIEQYRVRKRCSYQTGEEYYKRENICATCRKKGWQDRERREYVTHSNWSPAMTINQFERHIEQRREREREARAEGRKPIYD